MVLKEDKGRDKLHSFKAGVLATLLYYGSADLGSSCLSSEMTADLCHRVYVGDLESIT